MGGKWEVENGKREERRKKARVNPSLFSEFKFRITLEFQAACDPDHLRRP